MIKILHNQDQTYFNVTTIAGHLGIIEFVDGFYRAEYYSDKPMVTAQTDEELGQILECFSELYHLGEYDTFEEALTELIESFGIHSDLLNVLLQDPLSNEDWLIDSSVSDEIHFYDNYIKWKSQSYTNYFPKARELEREAEFYETYEPDPDQANKLYERAKLMYGIDEWLKGYEVTI